VLHVDDVQIRWSEAEFPVMNMSRCVVYVKEQENASEWYEAQLALPTHASSVVRAVKTLWFPSNKKGEVTEEDFELLKLHGHIGEGRLQLAEDVFLV
jgi:hypothetical protein